jgi:hypothetical protein
LRRCDADANCYANSVRKLWCRTLVGKDSN